MCIAIPLIRLVRSVVANVLELRPPPIGSSGVYCHPLYCHPSISVVANVLEMRPPPIGSSDVLLQSEVIPIRIPDVWLGHGQACWAGGYNNGL